jgi:hypothetical protein
MCWYQGGLDSVVGIATHYGVDSYNKTNEMH